jgi:hypothetical protein
VLLKESVDTLNNLQLRWATSAVVLQEDFCIQVHSTCKQPFSAGWAAATHAELRSCQPIDNLNLVSAGENHEQRVALLLYRFG